MCTEEWCSIVYLVNKPHVCVCCTLIEYVCADCGSNGVESRVLPAVRPPVKSGEPPLSAGSREQSSSLTPPEGWLEEAHREAGFSKPYTVSLSFFPLLPLAQLCGLYTI